MDDETTQALFRRWRDTKTVIALFPAIPTDLYGRFCEAYEHVGQHAGADYHGVIRTTTPVPTEVAAPLAEELRRLGYKLEIIRRASPVLHEKRRLRARALRMKNS